MVLGWNKQYKLVQPAKAFASLTILVSLTSGFRFSSHVLLKSQDENEPWRTIFGGQISEWILLHYSWRSQTRQYWHLCVGVWQHILRSGVNLRNMLAQFAYWIYFGFIWRSYREALTHFIAAACLKPVSRTNYETKNNSPILRFRPLRRHFCL